jgi:hypothetical protein
VFVGAPGTGGAPVPAPAGTAVAMPSLSADGTTVAFVDNATGSLRPYVYSATTGAAPALVGAASPGQVVQPALTPDASQLAYTVATAVDGPSGLAIPAGTASTVEVARSTSGLFTSSERELLSSAPVPAGTTSATPAISATGQLTIFATSNGAGSDVWAAQRPAALTVSPSATFDLGTVAIGSSSPPARVTFANPSTVGIALGPITPPGAPFAVVADTCSSVVVPAGGSCDVTVAFRPTDAVQSTATLTVGGEGVTATANLSGTGRELARTISMSPSTLQFPATRVGSRGGPVEATVSNTGEVPVTITSIGIDGSDAGEFVLTGNGCGGVVLDVDGTCTVAVTAIPSHSGSLRATISAAGSEGESASASLAATGTSAPTTTRPTPTTARPTTAPPLGRLQADPGSVTFEATPVGSTAAPAAVTVKNAGGSTVSSLKVQVLGGGEFALAADDCSGKSLAVDRTCTLSVTVTPTVGGGEAATLTISGSRGESTSVALSATAAFAPTLRVNPGVVRAGDTTTVVGSGFSPSSAVRLELVAPNGSGTPIPVATTTSDESGGFRVLVTVPGSIGQGGWRLQIPAGSSSDAAEVAVLIESAPPAPGMPGGGGVIRPGEQKG